MNTPWCRCKRSSKDVGVSGCEIVRLHPHACSVTSTFLLDHLKPHHCLFIYNHKLVQWHPHSCVFIFIDMFVHFYPHPCVFNFIYFYKRFLYIRLFFIGFRALNLISTFLLQMNCSSWQWLLHHLTQYFTVSIFCFAYNSFFYWCENQRASTGWPK
jgi:hypothetical protein